MKGQAAFFDGLIFLFLVVFSIGMVFVALNSYTIAQDKTIRSAYQVNYMYSLVKSLYYVDASTLQDVESYCDDFGAGVYQHYCDAEFDLDCKDLEQYKGLTTVVGLLKKDLSDPPSAENYKMAPLGPKLDDKFGFSEQLGRTAMRCAMKEFMKPFTFSGYRFLTEVVKLPSSGVGQERPLVPPYPDQEPEGDRVYLGDVVFTEHFKAHDFSIAADDPYSCIDVPSDQLLVVRTPFRVLVGGGPDEKIDEGFQERHYVLRTCLWPASESRKAG